MLCRIAQELPVALLHSFELPAGPGSQLVVPSVHGEEAVQMAPLLQTPRGWL